MKTITKFLTLVLSLFCVFGLVSPVYAEGEETKIGLTVLDVYNVEEITDSTGTTTKKIADKIYTISDRTYTFEVGKTYYFEFAGVGSSVLNAINLNEVIESTDGLENAYMGGSDSGGEYDDFGMATALKVTKAGLNLALNLGSDMDGNKITAQLITENPEYVTVSNFDDVTVESGTYDTACWPEITWCDEALQSGKDWSYELLESKDAGTTWTQLYKIVPNSGSDTMPVALTTNDSGRLFKLICTYDGVEIYNKTKTVTVVNKISSAEITEGTPTTSTTFDEGEVVSVVKENYLSEEQKEAVKDGASVSIKTVASKIEPTAEDKKLVEAQLNSTNKVAMYLDLKVLASVTKADAKVGEDVTVSETGTPVKFTVALDDSFINTKNTVDRTYQVVRIHNGVVDVLPATFDADSKTITFETDKFSTYALMYTDTPKASKTPATADGMNATLYGGVAVISVLAVGLLFFFKKRNA